MKATIAIETLGAQGDGIGRFGTEAVYIERALPGETVVADIARDKDGIWRGRLRELVSASPLRRQAPCRFYESCGGCSAQHMTEQAYRQWKTDKVAALLKAKGIVPQVWDDPVFVPAATRRRAGFTILRRQDRIIIGYHGKRSKTITDIPDCLVLHPGIMALRTALMPYLPHMIAGARPCDLFIQMADNGFEIVLTGFVGNKGHPDLAFREAAADIVHNSRVVRVGWRARERDEPEIIVEAAKPIIGMGKLTVTVPPRAFLQPSAEGQAALAAAVTSYMPGAGGHIADLFSGCGTFAGALLAAGFFCDAYEGDGASVQALKQAGHARSFCRDLFADPLGGGELNRYAGVVIDPPRAGAKAQSLALAQSAVPHIVAVSCNPATFARDALILQEGGYRLHRLRLIDQFTWSAHSELVGLFGR